MPQGDDFLTASADPTPAPAPVDDPLAAPAPVADDPAAAAPVDDTPTPPVTPDETPAEAKARSDRAFASMRRANEAQAARIAALEARLTPTPPAAAPPGPPIGGPQAPQPESYGTHAEYVQAVATWAVQQHAQVQEASKTAAHLQTAWDAQETQAKVKFADYDEAIQGDTTRYHPAVLQAIQTSDQGAEVAYHLATHAEEAARIAALPPVAALRALGRLEAQLHAAPVAAAASLDPTPPPTPKPRPLAPVGGAGAGGSAVSPDQLPYDEFVGWYKKTYGSR